MELSNIKSEYALNKIIGNLKKDKALKIIKYDKRLWNLFNLSIKDYKIYSEIELDIIPAKNEYGKFLNISNKEEEPYFHIYFNDNRKEIKKTFLT